jgi:hypothetical protein
MKATASFIPTGSHDDSGMVAGEHPENLVAESLSHHLHAREVDSDMAELRQAFHEASRLGSRDQRFAVGDEFDGGPCSGEAQALGIGIGTEYLDEPRTTSRRTKVPRRTALGAMALSPTTLSTIHGVF